MTRDSEKGKIAYYHLPGLFEFYELYRLFLPLFYERREWFYPWCEIGSVYGAPADCLWGGGRVGFGDNDARDVAALMREYGVSARLTFSNSLLREEHLSDRRCNSLCSLFEKNGGVQNGIIVHSELLLDDLRVRYPGFYFVSSTTKVLTDPEALLAELRREEFRYVVPDFRLNPRLSLWESLPEEIRGKVEFLCNECCDFGCGKRKECYQAVSRKALGIDAPEHICRAPGSEEGYVFSKAMDNPGYIGPEAIRETYLPMDYVNFKLEGRSLGSALVLEFLLHYMTKPEYQLKVRERIYLNASLDLF